MQILKYFLQTVLFFSINLYLLCKNISLNPYLIPTHKIKARKIKCAVPFFLALYISIAHLLQRYEMTFWEVHLFVSGNREDIWLVKLFFPLSWASVKIGNTLIYSEIQVSPDSLLSSRGRLSNFTTVLYTSKFHRKKANCKTIINGKKFYYFPYPMPIIKYKQLHRF